MKTTHTWILFALGITAGLALVTDANEGGPPLPRFTDQTDMLQLDSEGYRAGVCWIDFNSNGWPDLIAGGRLWINEKGKHFHALARVGHVVAADFDNDGWPDLFSWSQLKLYRNIDGQTVEEVPLPAFPEGYISQGASWGDFTGNGLVDLYVGGYEIWDRQITFPDFLLVNVNGTRFEVAWTNTERRARGVTACDYDENGTLDIYVSNYRLQPNWLWINDGTGQLRDEAVERNAVAASPGFAGGHSIGACWGDFNNSGHFDLFAGNFAHIDHRGDQPKSRFLRNPGPDGAWRFEDMGPCGIYYQESYASPAAADFDNDGHLDLFFTTVYPIAYGGVPNHSVLYHNRGGFRFRHVNVETGLQELPASYEAAWADFNNNGHLDLFTSGRLYVNQGTDHHWLKVRLIGDGQQVNRSAIGAQARIRIGDGILSRQVEAGTGRGNQNELTLHFGLGAHDQPVDLEIRWPDGTSRLVTELSPNQLITVTYGEQE